MLTVVSNASKVLLKKKRGKEEKGGEHATLLVGRIVIDLR